jgi:hypothetical protein
MPKWSYIMPRNGSGVYSKAAGSTAQTLTTISSTSYNATIDDLVDDANTARPIVAGGTGATTAAGARTNLGLGSLDTTYLKRIEAEGTIASATTCDIGAGAEYRLNVTGTTTIASFGTVANSRKQVRFSDALTLTYNATSLILPGAEDITTADGDVAEFVSDASGNWRCVNYFKAETTEDAVLTLFNASGNAPVFACRAWVNFDGTGTVAIRSSGNVSSITDNGTGDYTINFTTDMPDANYACVGTAGLIGAGNRGLANKTAFSASSVRIGTYATSSLQDTDNISVAIFR